jgi:hypothetical protein
VKESGSPVEQRQFLLAGAAWQETLLQSYRTLHVTIQGFLITAGAAVLAVQLTGAIQDNASQQETTRQVINIAFNVVFTTVLFLLFWLQRKTAVELQGIVQSRAVDINHWHWVTIMSENELVPEQRAFTYFKMWQHAHRADVKHLLPKYLPEKGISEEHAEELIGKGLGHTRNVLDISLFDRLQKIWWMVVVSSTTITLWFAIPFVELMFSR